MFESATIYQADARALPLADASVDCVVTSPPYWQVRDYGVDGQIGLEADPTAYVAELVAVFREVRRVLKPAGTLWLNLGDSYAGSGKNEGNTKPVAGKQATNAASHVVGAMPPIEGIKAKNLLGMPWRVALALQSDGWYLRQDIIWHKPNPMPESVRDRCTKAHEYLFMLSKSARYFYDADAIKEPCSENTHARVARQGLTGPNASWLGTDFSGERDIARDQAHPATAGKPPRKPRGWQSGAGAHDQIAHATPEGAEAEAQRRQPGFNPKAAGGGYGDDHRYAGLAASEKKFRPRQNESFSAAIAGQVLVRNKRSVWTIGSRGYKGAHFATFPEKLVEPCILAGCPVGGTVLDPFMGTGTTLAVAHRLGRNGIGVELKPEYIALARERMAKAGAATDVTFFDGRAA